MLVNLIMLFLAALALVTTATNTCVSETKYTLAMQVNNADVTLYALDVEAIDEANQAVLLVAASELNSTGTTVTEIGTNPDVNVNLELTDADPLTAQTGSFPLSVADMGELYGQATQVRGSKGFDWPHFFTTRMSIWPEMTSGAQMYMACRTVVREREYMALSWGLMASNGSMPTGCAPTLVKKQYSVPCPCQA